MTGSKILNKELPRTTRELRVKIAKLINKAGASHIGSCFSILEMLDAIYQSVDIEKIKSGAEDRDRVIISKGHSAVAVYTVLTDHGLMGEDILDTYGKKGSLLSGHVNHFVPFIEHSTGALGHGLSVAVGICIGMRNPGNQTGEVLCPCRRWGASGRIKLGSPHDGRASQTEPALCFGRL